MNIKFFLIKCFFLLSIISCSDDHTGELGEKTTNFVSRKLFNAQLEMTDSVYVKILLKAPIIEEYEYSEEPYTIFPKGLSMNFYETGKVEPGHLYADYAKIIEKKGWYEAKNNVIIINSDKDTLKTNHLFWDKSERKIFSEDTVKIYRSDGVTTNISTHGMEATEDFKNIKLKNNTGTLPYSDNLNQKN